MKALARTRLLSWLLPALTAPAVLLGAATPAAAAPSCGIDVYVAQLADEDGVIVGGYITVTVENERDVPSTGWRFTLGFPDDVTTTAYWSSQLTSPDLVGTVGFKNVAWNGALPPDGTATAGLTVTVRNGASPVPRSWACSTTA